MTNEEIAERVFQTVLKHFNLKDSEATRALFTAGGAFGFALRNSKGLKNWEGCLNSYWRKVNEQTD